MEDGLSDVETQPSQPRSIGSKVERSRISRQRTFEWELPDDGLEEFTAANLSSRNRYANAEYAANVEETENSNNESTSREQHFDFGVTFTTGLGEVDRNTNPELGTSLSQAPSSSRDIVEALDNEIKFTTIIGEVCQDPEFRTGAAQASTNGIEAIDSEDKLTTEEIEINTDCLTNAEVSSISTSCIQPFTDGASNFDWETSDSGFTIKESSISNWGDNDSDHELITTEDLCTVSSLDDDGVHKFEQETSDSGLTVDGPSNFHSEERSVGSDSADQDESNIDANNLEPVSNTSYIDQSSVTNCAPSDLDRQNIIGYATADSNSDISNLISNHDISNSISNDEITNSISNDEISNLISNHKISNLISNDDGIEDAVDSNEDSVSDVNVSDGGSEFVCDSDEDEDSEEDESDIDESYIASPQPSNSKNKGKICDICGKTVACHLNRHRNTHLGGDRCKCTVCGKIYKRKDYLKHHMEIQHGNVAKTHTCQVCGKSFVEATCLKKHVATHTREDQIECPVCYKMFANNRILDRHLRLHYGQRDYKCKDCGKEFGRKDSLQVHITSVHQDPDPVKCEICDKVFRHQLSLIRHRITHKETKFECDICGRLLGEKRQLVRHLQTHYGIKNFECDICGRWFGRKDLAKAHRLLHTQVKEKLPCQICKKIFKSKRSLIGHQQTHRQKPRHECLICGKTYKGNRSFNKHLRFHQGVKDHKCEICGRRFQERYYLQVHLRIHSGNVPDGTLCQFCESPYGSCFHTRKNEYPCSICLQVLRSESGYRTHMAIHNENKRFKCSVCGRRFIQNVTMLKHMKQHIPQRTHKCDYCGKKFLNEEDLDEHMPIHGSRTIQCEICSKFYTTVLHLRDHMKSHKAAASNENQTKECKVCGKILLSSYTLSKHLKNHYNLADVSS